MNVNIGDTYNNILFQIVKDYKSDLKELSNKLQEFEDLWINNIEYEILENGDFKIIKIRSSVADTKDSNLDIENA